LSIGESGLAALAFVAYVQSVLLLFASILMSKAWIVVVVLLCAKLRPFPTRLTVVPLILEMTAISELTGGVVSLRRMLWPATRPALLATVMLLAPTAELAARVVVATGVYVQSMGRKMSLRWKFLPESPVRMTMSL
jgi:hypothetical protein